MKPGLLSSFLEHASEALEAISRECPPKAHFSSHVFIPCLFALAFLSAFSCTPLPPLFSLSLALALALLLKADFKRLGKLALWITALTLLIVIPMAFYRAAIQEGLSPLHLQEIFSLKLLSHSLLLALKAVSAGITLSVAVHCLGLSEFLKGLYKLRAPRILLLHVCLLLKLIPLLLRDASRMLAARESRLIAKSSIHQRLWRILASSTGDLLLRSFERSHRLHLALLSRGGFLPSRAEDGFSITTKDLTLILATAVIICMSIYMAW